MHTKPTARLIAKSKHVRISLYGEGTFHIRKFSHPYHTRRFCEGFVSSTKRVLVSGVGSSFGDVDNGVNTEENINGCVRAAEMSSPMQWWKRRVWAYRRFGTRNKYSPGMPAVENWHTTKLQNKSLPVYTRH